MQESFGFGAGEIGRWREQLTRRFGPLAAVPRRTPIGQLVKSLISSRTRDAVSLAAFHRILVRWPRPGGLAAASPSQVEREIGIVTFADVKAVNLVETLRMIEAAHPDFDLAFLGALRVEDALAWLERHPGVGRKVAAATLNASTLGRPVFIVDSHVHRVLQRLGFVGGKASPRAASELVTASASSLSADDLLELFARMKRLGQTICRFEEPHCALCPLADCCRTASKHVTPPRTWGPPSCFRGNEKVDSGSGPA
jgi:endonuclease-3